MTLDEFLAVLRPKVQGTWNLHNVALEREIELDFFTLLSSICGIAGARGQANYSAANVFLDSFASYRQTLGLRANSVSLGVIEDVGYLNEHDDISRRLFSSRMDTDSGESTPQNSALFDSATTPLPAQQC
jgi:hypothetical protein